MWRVSTSIVAVATLESRRKTATQRDWSYSKAVFLPCRFPNLPNPVQLSTSTGCLAPKPCSLISCKMRPTWNGWWEQCTSSGCLCCLWWYSVRGNHQCPESSHDMTRHSTHLSLPCECVSKKSGEFMYPLIPHCTYFKNQPSNLHPARKECGGSNDQHRGAAGAPCSSTRHAQWQWLTIIIYCLFNQTQTSINMCWILH